jgi:hypothetical protein
LLPSEVNSLFSIHSENVFFEKAHILQTAAKTANGEGKFLLSWTLSSAARCCFLLDLIINVASVTLAILGAAFGGLAAIVTWGKETRLLDNSIKLLQKKISQLALSLIGAFLSPWLVVEGYVPLKLNYDTLA